MCKEETNKEDLSDRSNQDTTTTNNLKCQPSQSKSIKEPEAKSMMKTPSIVKTNNSHKDIKQNNNDYWEDAS